MKYVKHRFGPNETIRGAIRLHNHQSMTEFMLNKLMNDYNVVNENRAPRMGEEVSIPVFEGFIGSGKPL